MASVSVHAFCGYAKICKFSDALAVEKDVGGLYVAMDLFVGVKINQTFQH